MLFSTGFGSTGVPVPILTKHCNRKSPWPTFRRATTVIEGRQNNSNINVNGQVALACSLRSHTLKPAPNERMSLTSRTERRTTQVLADRTLRDPPRAFLRRTTPYQIRINLQSSFCLPSSALRNDRTVSALGGWSQRYALVWVETGREPRARSRDWSRPYPYADAETNSISYPRAGSPCFSVSSCLGELTIYFAFE